MGTNMEPPRSVSNVELPCFSADTCYVHVKIPAADTLGHRADAWNVAKPNYQCRVTCLTKGDLFIVRLLTEEEGELFAEAIWYPDRPMVSVRFHPCLLIGDCEHSCSVQDVFIVRACA
jgi:Protein of unknown function (DUF1681)